MINRTKPFGRLILLAVGALLVIVAVPFILQASTQLLMRASSILAALVVFYIAVHAVVSRIFSNLNPWLGAVLANLPVVLVFILGRVGGLLFGAGEGQIAAIIYVGISLLIAALRADPGCEVMSIPGLLAGKHTHLACIAFSPIDWLENKLSGNG